MKVTVDVPGRERTADLRRPIDISIPLRSGAGNPNAFGIGEPRFTPFRAGGFVGSVAEGGPCNCEDLFINPHGNGTHTECVGHIAAERYTINSCLHSFHFPALLHSLHPEDDGEGGLHITAESLRALLSEGVPEALIVRTLPNSVNKRHMRWSGANPPYLAAEACALLCRAGVQHLLVDLPSVDPEQDEGRLAAHRAWWNYPAAPRTEATITEMIYVPDSIADGWYLLNIQIAALETDASPSKPVLYILD